MNFQTFSELKSFLGRTIISSLFLLGVFCRLAFCEAQVPAPEYVDKARSLALLPVYVKWPNPSGSAINVGILGNDEFGGALDKMNPKRSKHIDDLKHCQIIFVAKSEQENLDAILESLEGQNILTVGESEGFAKRGGAIGFVIKANGLVGFEINSAAVRRAGLAIDLRLLKLAVRVFTS